MLELDTALPDRFIQNFVRKARAQFKRNETRYRNQLNQFQASSMAELDNFHSDNNEKYRQNRLAFNRAMTEIRDCIERSCYNFSPAKEQLLKLVPKDKFV